MPACVSDGVHRCSSACHVPARTSNGSGWFSCNAKSAASGTAQTALAYHVVLSSIVRCLFMGATNSNHEHIGMDFIWCVNGHLYEVSFAACDAGHEGHHIRRAHQLRNAHLAAVFQLRGACAACIALRASTNRPRPLPPLPLDARASAEMWCSVGPRYVQRTRAGSRVGCLGHLPASYHVQDSEDWLALSTHEVTQDFNQISVSRPAASKSCMQAAKAAQTLVKVRHEAAGAVRATRRIRHGQPDPVALREAVG